jgi:Fe-S-cluster-containing dehydrogenase component
VTRGEAQSDHTLLQVNRHMVCSTCMIACIFDACQLRSNTDVHLAGCTINIFMVWWLNPHVSVDICINNFLLKHGSNVWK